MGPRATLGRRTSWTDSGPCLRPPKRLHHPKTPLGRFLKMDFGPRETNKGTPCHRGPTLSSRKALNSDQTNKQILGATTDLHLLSWRLPLHETTNHIHTSVNRTPYTIQTQISHGCIQENAHTHIEHNRTLFQGQQQTKQRKTKQNKPKTNIICWGRAREKVARQFRNPLRSSPRQRPHRIQLLGNKPLPFK